MAGHEFANEENLLMKDENVPTVLFWEDRGGDH